MPTETENRQALRVFLDRAYQDSLPDISKSPDHLEVVGSWAHERGLVSGTMATPEGSEPQPVEFTYGYVYRKLVEEGRWVLVWDIYNSNSS